MAQVTLGSVPMLVGYAERVILLRGLAASMVFHDLLYISGRVTVEAGLSGVFRGP